MRCPIKERRLKLGLTIADVMAKTGLAWNSVVFAERGVNCTEKTAALLSVALRMKIDPVLSAARREQIMQRYRARRQRAEMRQRGQPQS